VHHVVLDTDLAMGAPGSDIDDGFALALALGDPGIALDLVTTVAGNTDVDTATTLTLELLHRSGHPEVPVHRGAPRALLRPHERPGTVPADVPRREPAGTLAAAALVRHVLSRPGEITVVAIGPLTNLALALRLEPRFATAVRRVVVMGGEFLGASHDLAMPGEFNLWSDPEAAQVLLGSGAPLEFVGLDVTRQVRVSREESLEMAGSDRPFTAFAGEYTAAWIDQLDPRYADPPGTCALHDPLAVAAVTRPDLLTWRDAHVEVECGDRLRGVVVTDLLDGPNPPAANCRVAVAVDAEGFREHFRAGLARLG
jgi:inosine-uridine nucleoside N-ribohydrolase